MNIFINTVYTCLYIHLSINLFHRYLSITTTTSGSSSSISEDESGVGASRLYGICVLHPRILKTPISIKPTAKQQQQQQQQNNSSSDSSDSSRNSGGGLCDPSYDNEYIDFESTVCYAFITR